jgi:hypothetical protein
MIDYIKEYKNAFSDEFCDRVIREREEKVGSSYYDVVCWQDKDINTDWLPYIDEINKYATPHIDDYFKTFGEITNLNSIYLPGFGVVRQPIGAHDPMHHDIETIINEDNVRIRPFVSLIYLNDKEFTGGQLIFPIQKRVIEPEKGKLIIFPASYMFPHQVLHIAGGDRFFIRLNYMLKPDMKESDLDVWTTQR